MTSMGATRLHQLLINVFYCLQACSLVIKSPTSYSTVSIYYNCDHGSTTGD